MISSGWIAQVEGNLSSKFRWYITKQDFYNGVENEHLMYYNISFSYLSRKGIKRHGNR